MLRIIISYSKPYNCVQINDYYQIEMITLNHIIISITSKSYNFAKNLLIIRGCSCGVMVKAMGLWNHSKRVRTPVALLRSLSGKYPWERYDPPYPPSYGLNSTTIVLRGEIALALNNLQRLICQLKTKNPNQTLRINYTKNANINVQWVQFPEGIK